MTDGWQPIETAPRDQTFVDLWVRHPDGFSGRLPRCQRSLLDRWGWRYGQQHIPPEWATHWMPEPEGPES